MLSDLIPVNPMNSFWDRLCSRCQCMVKAHGFEEESKKGPRFQAVINAEQQERKMKELEKKIKKAELEESLLREQLQFLQSWDPFVMSPACTDVRLQAAGHVVYAHKAVLVNHYPISFSTSQLKRFTHEFKAGNSFVFS